MKKTALVLRTALMTMTLAVSLLPIRDSGPGTERYDISPFDRGILEELFCWQCGETEFFWVDYTIDHSGQLTLEDSWMVEGTITPVGIHGRMSMCLNCGIINSDLSPDNERFGNNIFLLEPCTIEHQLEDICYEIVDAEYHKMTAIDAKHCLLCDDSRGSEPVTDLKQHDFTTEVVEPTCAEGGYTIYNSFTGGFTNHEFFKKFIFCISGCSI